MHILNSYIPLPWPNICKTSQALARSTKLVQGIVWLMTASHKLGSFGSLPFHGSAAENLLPAGHLCQAQEQPQLQHGYVHAAELSCLVCTSCWICRTEPELLRPVLIFPWCFAEAFVVCQDYSPPAGFQATDLASLLSKSSSDYFAVGAQPSLEAQLLIPFLACGDLSGFDADQSYDLPGEGYVPLPPVQPPTAPAYRGAVEQQRQRDGMGRPGRGG